MMQQLHFFYLRISQVHKSNKIERLQGLNQRMSLKVHGLYYYLLEVDSKHFVTIHEFNLIQDFSTSNLRQIYLNNY